MLCQSAAKPLKGRFNDYYVDSKWNRSAENDIKFYKLLKMKFTEILNSFDIKEANDLYEPAISVYPKLEEYAQNSWFFSGSGSSFFKVNNVK